MSIRFLIVDDTKFMRKMLTDILKGMDYEVVGEADNGTTAVQMFKQLRPDVTFMDIYMPEVDGIEAMQQIRSIDPKAIVIVCSGTSQQYLISDAMKMGANGYVMKPFKPKQISEVIQKYVLPHLSRPEQGTAASAGKDGAAAERKDKPGAERAAERQQAQEKETQVKREESREAQQQAMPDTQREAQPVSQAQSPRQVQHEPQAEPNAAAPERSEQVAAQAEPAAQEGLPHAWQTEPAEPAARHGAGGEVQTQEQTAASLEPAADLPSAPEPAADLAESVDDWTGVEAEEEIAASSEAREAEETEEEITLIQSGEPELDVLAADPAKDEGPDEADESGLRVEVLEAEPVEGDELLVFNSEVPAWNADEDPEDDHPVLPAAEVIPISELKGGSSKEESGLKDFKSCISCRWKEDVADQEVVYNVTCYEGESFLRIESSVKGEELLLSFDGLRNLLQWLDRHAIQVTGTRKEVARHS